MQTNIKGYRMEKKTKYCVADVWFQYYEKGFG